MGYCLENNGCYCPLEISMRLIVFDGSANQITAFALVSTNRILLKLDRNMVHVFYFLNRYNRHTYSVTSSMHLSFN